MSMSMDAILEKNPNLIIGKYGCPYCDKARNLLKEKSISYTYIINTENRELAEYVKTKFQHNTFPHVFLDGVFVGGFTEVEAILLNNKKAS